MRDDVICKVGDETYPVIKLPVMGGELARDEGGGMRDEILDARAQDGRARGIQNDREKPPLVPPVELGGNRTIVTATGVVRFVGTQWACRQDVPGIIYWIPKPAMDITREMRRIQHDLAEWRSEFTNEARRATGKMGFRALQILMDTTGFDVYVCVSSYPKDDIRVFRGQVEEIAGVKGLLLRARLYPPMEQIPEDEEEQD